MRKFLAPLLASSLFFSALNVSCGSIEEPSSQVKMDPVTIAQAVGAIYGAYSDLQRDRKNEQNVRQIKDLIIRHSALIRATIHEVNDNNIIVKAESALGRFELINQWNDTDYSNAFQTYTELNALLVDTVKNGIPKSAVAAAKALALMAPTTAIVVTLKFGESTDSDAYVRNNVLAPADQALRHYLKVQFPRFLRETNPGTHYRPFNVKPSLLWTTKWFKMNNHWQWEGQIVAMFQFIAPMEAEYITIEGAQKSIAGLIGAAAEPRAYLEGAYIMDTGMMAYLNGTGAYCGFASPDHVGHTGNNFNFIRDRGLTLNPGYLATLANHGLCRVPKIPVGFFKMSSQPEIFWSNGENAYCWVPAPKYVTGPVAHYNYDIHAATTFRRDGQCASMP